LESSVARSSRRAFALTLKHKSNQEFQFNLVSNGYGELQNQNSGKDLVVQGASTCDGAPIIQYTQNGTSGGRWLPIRLSDGTWQFKNDKSGLCPDMTGKSTTAGTQFEQWSCKSSAVGSNQAFAVQLRVALVGIAIFAGQAAR
jgi:chitinase